MTEYTNLIKALRDCSTVNSLSHYKRGLMAEAADAIEGLELSCKNFEDALKDAVDELEKVERKKGKWEFVSDDYIDDAITERCSLCGRQVTRYETEQQDNFCPNCGADMREES